MDLSVVIPVHNAEKHLARTLDSVLAQGALPYSWEVLAVDDGSTDESPAILREYAARAEKAGITFRTLAFPNGGVGVCRNRGLVHARGDAVLFLDSDDFLDPGALSYAMKKKAETGAAILLFDSRFAFPDGSTRPFPSANHPGGAMSVRDYMLAQPCPWNKICDRALFTETGLRFEEGILYEDLAVIPALGSAAEGRIFYAKKAVHSYYQSEGSIMRAPWSAKRLDLLRALLALEKNAKDRKTEVEYLYFLHLYRNFVWQAWDAGERDAVRQANRLMKARFPHWQKNPLVRSLSARKERLTALLFYHECFSLIRLWKGTKR